MIPITLEIHPTVVTDDVTATQSDYEARVSGSIEEKNKQNTSKTQPVANKSYRPWQNMREYHRHTTHSDATYRFGHYVNNSRRDILNYMIVLAECKAPHRIARIHSFEINIYIQICFFFHTKLCGWRTRFGSCLAFGLAELAAAAAKRTRSDMAGGPQTRMRSY